MPSEPFFPLGVLLGFRRNRETEELAWAHCKAMFEYVKGAEPCLASPCSVLSDKMQALN